MAIEILSVEALLGRQRASVPPESQEPESHELQSNNEAKTKRQNSGIGLVDFIRRKSWIPLTIYFLQLLLNWIWTWIFFEAKILLLALVEICLLDVAVAGCLVCFGIVRLTAGALLVPYMAWLILATYLNFYAHNNN
uniref:Translocator protein n=1 Tax=Lygus hesperus TaxID=30085 RepID=A0A146M641_LYGHE